MISATGKGEVLTTTSTIGCGHKPGSVKGETITTSSKLHVSGSAVLLGAEPDQTQQIIDQWKIVGCPNGDKQCTKPAVIREGMSQKLKVEGAPVLLSTLSGTTDKGGNLSVQKPAAQKAKVIAA